MGKLANIKTILTFLLTDLTRSAGVRQTGAEGPCGEGN